uniref:Large ribosomal subunit protein uL24 C-terminal domain-containing protein n=1 Tax=Tetradesmus obliquus TaxID=3088 RepID=A0A383VH90_TETOB|eukprot:jgi/Sobl393_1/12164/SZX64867.1
MVTRHIRGDVDPDSGEKVPGYTVKYEHPIHYSNVMLLDPEKNTPVRVTMKYEDQPPFRKVRMTRGKKASGCIVPWPEAWKKDPYPSTDEGAKDTKPEEAAKVTYNPAADFTMQVPAHHRQLRQLRELRDAAAAAAAAAAKQQQQQRQQRPSRGSLFGSSSSRSYHSSSRGKCAAEVQQVQEMLSGCSLGGSGSVLQLLQRLPFSSSSSSSVSRLLCRGFGSRAHLSSWCGLAAAPLLV